MADGDSKPNDPLSPYYPSVPGGGRTWAAVLLALLLLSGALFVAVSVLRSP